MKEEEIKQEINKLKHNIEHPFWRGDYDLHFAEQQDAEIMMRHLWLLVNNKIDDYILLIDLFVEAEEMGGNKMNYYSILLKIDIERFNDREHVLFVAKNRVKWANKMPVTSKFGTYKKASEQLNEAKNSNWKHVGEEFCQETKNLNYRN